MIIVRATNSKTGEVFEITSETHPTLNYLEEYDSDLFIIGYSAHMLEEMSVNADKVEVIRK